MINSSSSSPRRSRRGLLYGVGGVVLVVLAVNFAGTLLAIRALGSARREMREVTGYTLDVGGVFFNVLRGLSLSNVTVSKDEQLLLDAGRVDLGFEGLSYFRAPLRIKNMRVRTLRLVTARITELADAGRRLGRPESSISIYNTFRFSCRDVYFDNTVHLDFSGYLNIVSKELYTLRGRLSVLKIRYPAFPDFDVFDESYFYQPFDYEFQAVRKDDTLEIAPIEFSNSRLKVYGGATVTDLTREKPSVDLKLEMANILLDDLPVLNRGNVRTRGILDIVGVLKGEILRPETALSVTLKNGDVTFFDSLYFSKMQGTMVFARNQFLGEGLSLELNGVPLTADLRLFAQLHPRVYLSLRSLSQVAGMSQFIWQMEADWKGDHLRGAAGGAVRNLARDTVQEFAFDLRDFRLGYDEDLYLYSRYFDVDLKTMLRDGASVDVFERGVEFEYFFGVLRKLPDGFGFKHVKASCYGGNLEGEVFFTPVKKQLYARGELHVREVNIRKYTEVSSPQSTLTRGQLGGDLRFDNREEEQVKGQIFVANGEIERNPILNAVADYLGILSLKRLPFGDLSIYFKGGRGDYNVDVELTSSLVNAQLESKVIHHDTMDGYLSASLSSELLNESRSFSRLLKYLKHDEPYVVFPFKISSYISSPRILWLKNEFKEKIQNKLPERNKRYLQGQINKFVEQAGN